MIAFGGSAPLHAGRLAQKLGIAKVLIPNGAGVGSAIGFLRAPVSFEVVRSDLSVLLKADPKKINDLLAVMRFEALEIVTSAVARDDLNEMRLAELRYVGQGHALSINIPTSQYGPLTMASLYAIVESFEKSYEQIYGLRVPDCDVEVVTWSVTISTPSTQVQTVHLPESTHTRHAKTHKNVWEPAVGEVQPFGIYWRFDLSPAELILGPALVVEDETTLVVPAGWAARLDEQGNLVMESLP